MLEQNLYPSSRIEKSKRDADSKSISRKLLSRSANSQAKLPIKRLNGNSSLSCKNESTSSSSRAHQSTKSKSSYFLRTRLNSNQGNQRLKPSVSNNERPATASGNTSNTIFYGLTKTYRKNKTEFLKKYIIKGDRKKNKSATKPTYFLNRSRDNPSKNESAEIEDTSQIIDSKNSSKLGRHNLDQRMAKLNNELSQSKLSALERMGSCEPELLKHPFSFGEPLTHKQIEHPSTPPIKAKKARISKFERDPYSVLYSINREDEQVQQRQSPNFGPFAEGMEKHKEEDDTPRVSFNPTFQDIKDNWFDLKIQDSPGVLLNIENKKKKKVERTVTLKSADQGSFVLVEDVTGDNFEDNVTEDSQGFDKLKKVAKNKSPGRQFWDHSVSHMTSSTNSVSPVKNDKKKKKNSGVVKIAKMLQEEKPTIELQPVPLPRRAAIKIRKISEEVQSPSTSQLRQTIDFNDKVLGEIRSAETKKVPGFYDNFSPRQDLTNPEIIEVENGRKKKYSGQLSEWITSLTPLNNGGTKTAKIFPLTSVEFPCSCKRKAGDTLACEKARRWIHLVFERNGKTFDYELYRQQYERLADFEENSQSLEQINKDLMRTFPKSEYFGSPESPGIKRLKRILHAFALYDRGVGYVQGMNFIVGQLMYHCREQIAFWLFISLLQDYEVRDIYEHGLPGLYKHCQIIDLLIMEQLDKIYHHFCENGVVVQLFATDWIFSLFSSVIPFDKMVNLVDIQGHFLGQFFEQGWPFFYKFILSCLKHYQEVLLNGEDIGSILQPLKHWDDTGLPSNKVVSQSAVFSSFSIFKSHKDPWDKLLSSAKAWKINVQHINYLLSNYDPKIKTFKFKREAKNK